MRIGMNLPPGVKQQPPIRQKPPIQVMIDNQGAYSSVFELTNTSAHQIDVNVMSWSNGAVITNVFPLDHGGCFQFTISAIMPLNLILTSYDPLNDISISYINEPINSTSPYDASVTIWY